MIILLFFFMAEVLTVSQESYARFIEKQLLVTLTDERVNGHCFTHRTDALNGTVKEMWAIDGKMVNHDEYTSAILDAEREERRVEREKKDQAQKDQLQAQIGVQRACYEKLITLYINDIMRSYHKLADGRLRLFWIFEKSTFSGAQEVEQLVNEHIPTVQALLKNKETPLEVLQKYAHDFENAVDKLTAMYHSTILHAQKNADDPRLLKELLAMTTEL
jgi:hypothetical protein